MPTLSGLELIRMIRARPEQRSACRSSRCRRSAMPRTRTGRARPGRTATSRSRSTSRRSTGFSRRSSRRGFRRRREPPPAGRRTASPKEFLAEAETLLEEAGACLDTLDDQGDDPNPANVNALFRAVHSLKGVAAMVGSGGRRRGRARPRGAPRRRPDGARRPDACRPRGGPGRPRGPRPRSSARVAAGEEAPALARAAPRRASKPRSSRRRPRRSRPHPGPSRRPRRVALRLRAAPRRRGGAAGQGARPRRPRPRVRHVRHGTPDGDGRGLGGGRADRDLPGRRCRSVADGVPPPRGASSRRSTRRPSVSGAVPARGGRRGGAPLRPRRRPLPSPAWRPRRRSRKESSGSRSRRWPRSSTSPESSRSPAVRSGRALGRRWPGLPIAAARYEAAARLLPARPARHGARAGRPLSPARPGGDPDLASRRGRSPGRRRRSERKRTSSSTASRPRSTRSSPTSSPTRSSTSCGTRWTTGSSVPRRAWPPESPGAAA